MSGEKNLPIHQTKKEKRFFMRKNNASQNIRKYMADIKKGNTLVKLVVFTIAIHQIFIRWKSHEHGFKVKGETFRNREHYEMSSQGCLNFDILSNERFNRSHVNVIARSHPKEDPLSIKAFMASLAAQTFQNFTVWIINGNNSNIPIFEKEVKYMNDTRFLVKRFPVHDWKKFTKGFHSYGYYSTELALREILRNSYSETRSKKHEFLLITNTDNLYNRRFFSSSLETFDSCTCMVASDFTSRYRVHGGFSENRPLEVEFAKAKIDLGSVLLSLPHVHFTFNKKTFFVKNDKFADWLFFRRILQKFGYRCGRKTGELLFVHQ